MIISASRRTDIPAFFAKWFVNRIREGYVYVRNPINPRQISKISLSQDIVDCIVFWTKNPANFLPYLDELARYNSYFQFTITPYGQELEPGLPQKPFLIELFKELSGKLGKNRVIWRYDPIVISHDMPVAFHTSAFAAIAAALHGYTRRCVISFLDMYKKCERNMKDVQLLPIAADMMRETAKCFAEIAARNELELVTCAEEIDLSSYGIAHGKCIDDHGYEIQSKLRGIIPSAARDCSTNQSHSAAHTELEFHNKLIKEISGRSLQIGKDKTQRPLCGCVTSIDIGAYNTCLHGCLYCYANSNLRTIKNNLQKHNPASPLLLEDA